MDLIISNVSSLVATLVDMFSSSRKKARDLLLVQCISQFFYGLSVIVLKGYSGAVQNAICIIRNIAAACKVKSKWLEWVLVVLAVALGLFMVFINKNDTAIWISLLPILANLEYTLAIFHFKDREVPIKAAFFFHVGLYLVYDIMLRIYVGAIANLVLMITTSIFVIKSLRTNK